jgi:hypothetical protein
MAIRAMSEQARPRVDASCTLGTEPEHLGYPNGDRDPKGGGGLAASRNHLTGPPGFFLCASVIRLVHLRS